MTTVTVVTPWKDHMELADDYWEALAYENCEVLVVDNGSEPALPNAVRLNHNSGFSHACNLGLDLARTDAVLFLNNDIWATERGWVRKLADQLEPGVLVGPMLRFDSHTVMADTPLPYLDGWCLMGMRDDLLELGGFDEGYEEPAYYSDNDLCFRARLAGMVLREVRCGVHHKGGVTSNANGWVLPETLANRERFEKLVESELGVAA
jgi:GT2 family glycosyltransferase